MSYWIKIAACIVIFTGFLLFQFGVFHVYGITRILSALLDIAGPFAALYLIILLFRSGDAPKQD